MFLMGKSGNVIYWQIDWRARRVGRVGAAATAYIVALRDGKIEPVQ